MRRLILAGSFTLVVAAGPVLPVPAAHAAFPGANGRIAFTSARDGFGEIYVMNADGSAQTNLTNNAGWDDYPAWSPGGAKIAFRSSRDGNAEIYVMNADGSAQARLTNNTSIDWYPAWSADGTKVAFTSLRDGNFEIYVMNADGSAQTNLTNNNAALDDTPAWSPVGTKIAFRSNDEIYVMNADGSAQTNLTNNAASDGLPAWSPDGAKIAFQSSRDGNSEIYVMNADGSAQTNLTNNAASDFDPAWSPDGTKITFGSLRDGNDEIYVMNADGSGQTRLTNDPGDDFSPDWQPLSLPVIGGPPANPTLTIQLVGHGNGKVTSAPAGISCPPDCSEQVAPGSNFTLTATPDADSTFVRWSGGGCPQTGTCGITVNSDVAVSAWFDPGASPSPSPSPTPSPGSFDLNASKDGKGRIVSTPEGISCGQGCTATFEEGTSVTLTATAHPGWTFKRWHYGACKAQGPVCTFDMTSNRRAEAVFVKAPIVS